MSDECVISRNARNGHVTWSGFQPSYQWFKCKNKLARCSSVKETRVVFYALALGQTHKRIRVCFPTIRCGWRDDEIGLTIRFVILVSLGWSSYLSCLSITILWLKICPAKGAGTPSRRPVRQLAADHIISTVPCYVRVSPAKSDGSIATM